MRNMGIIFSTSMKNNFTSKAVAVIWYGIALLLASGMIILFGVLLIGPEAGKLSPDRSQLELYMAVTMFSVSLIGLGVNLNALGFTSMIREKAKGNIQSLLVTNLSIKDIWLAKTLAVFVPGLIAGTVLTLATLLVLNFVYFVPAVGFLINPWISITSFIIYPALYLCLGLLVNLVGLTNKPVNANIIAQVFLPVFINVVIQVMLRSSFMDYTSWQFMLINLGFVIIVGAVVLIVAPRISKERVVLSY
jgi:ABC-type Na+ efflux pump permease subunit